MANFAGTCTSDNKGLLLLLLLLHLSLCLTLCFFSHHLCEMWCGKKCVCEESQMRYFTNHLLKHYHDDTCCRLSDCYSNTFITGFIDPGCDSQSTANTRHKYTTASRFCGAAADPYIRFSTWHNREGHRRLNSNLKASLMFGFLITLREETLSVYHTHQGGKSETNTAQL